MPATPSEHEALVAREFARRAADGDRLRLLIVGGLAVFGAVEVTIAPLVFPDLVARVFDGEIPRGPVLAVCFALLVYAAAGRAYADRRRASGELPPRAFRFLVAGVEASVPTAAIATTLAWFGVYGLFSPPVGWHRANAGERGRKGASNQLSAVSLAA